MAEISPEHYKFNEGFYVNFSYKLLFLAILSSGFVLFEPAPFDLLILTSIFLALLGSIAIPKQIKWVLLLSLINLIGSFLGVLMSERFADSYMHIIITAYMVLFSIGLLIMVYNNPFRVLNIVIIAYIFAALITTILAILGYFHIGPTYELFTLYGRAKGGFKDPNVYGPFIIPPMIYLIDRVIYSNLKYKFLCLFAFTILLFGLLLSFSRGAWGLFLIATLILFVSMYFNSSTNRFRIKLSLYIMTAILFACVVLVIAINIPSIADLLTQRASLTQSYDVEDGGRFSHHVDAMKIIVQQPWGIGAKEFGWTYGEDVHNTYLTMFLIGGWIGGFSFLIIMIITLLIGFKYCFFEYDLRRIYVVFYTSFFGLALEAWIIDIDHWRVLYILIAAIWGVIFYQRYNQNTALN